MRPTILTAIFLSLLTALAPANVVRKAPDFTWPAAGNKNRSLRSLNGQPVVLVIAKNPKTGAFRKQAEWLKLTYQQLAAKGTVFIAAFQQSDEGLKSDIPFVVANNGGGVASAYGVQGDFTLVVIGKDGNVDYQTEKVRTGERVRDIIINNFETQAATRGK